VMIISAGTALLPACVQNDKSSISLKNIPLTRLQEQMLAVLTETIIPKTSNFTGANDLQAHEFVLTMMDDCASPADQQKFTAGMQSFDEACKKKWNNSFVKCTPQQRNELLQSMEKKQDVPEQALAFYRTVKHYTLQSFTSSKEYMTGIKKYKMVPGPGFKGCVPV
jgi:hypothetical protein